MTNSCRDAHIPIFSNFLEKHGNNVVATTGPPSVVCLDFFKDMNRSYWMVRRFGGIFSLDFVRYFLIGLEFFPRDIFAVDEKLQA
jgi:hypothetical protein